MRKLHIGLVGFGSVGERLALYLTQEQETLIGRTQCEVVLEKIFTRSPHKIKENSAIHDSLIADSWQSIIRDEKINCIVELMGGTDVAKQYIIEALKAGKDVVTANKAVLAEHGRELWDIARKNNVCIAFEASCGGGIPIIRAITDGLIANKITAVYGVLNGSCNYILSEMDKKHKSFSEALEDAKIHGYVEADPSLDTEGIDAAHKIAIISGLVYNVKVDFVSLFKRGISDIKNSDIQFAKKLGYTTKLIAAGIDLHDSISIWVHPAFLPDTHPMSSIEGSFNAISVLGNKVGHTMYVGKGAGGDATASAVIADLVSIANGTSKIIFNSNTLWPDKNSASLQSDMNAFVCPIYIRLFIKDEIGILSKVATILAKNDISIARVLQEDFPHSEYVDRAGLATLIIITHRTQWSNIEKAKKELLQLVVVQGSFASYPIIEEIEG